MSALRNSIVLACSLSGVCWAARCTTVVDPGVLREYQNYVAAAEQAMEHRSDSGNWRGCPIVKPNKPRRASHPATWFDGI